MTNKEKIVEALVYIEWNLKEKIDIPAIANEIGYSQHYFKKLFKQITGYNISTYLLKRRLTEAFKEIAADPENLLKIANEYKFSCFSEFTNLFFRQFRIQPYDIKKGYSYQTSQVQEPIVRDIIGKI